MNEELLLALIDKNVIQKGTKIGIIRPGVGMDGSKIISDRILVSSKNDKECTRSQANHITEI